MRVQFGRFRPTDTVEQIARELALRPANYILFQATPACGGDLQGCLGKKAFEHRKSKGAVVISILQ